MGEITADDSRGIVHDRERQCFVANLGHSEALLEYTLLSNHGINFHRTFVPEAMRGQGIAEKLVTTGLTWAQQQNFRIEASCWYVQRFMRT